MNIHGFKHKLTKLQSFLHKYNVHIILIQESLLKPNSHLNKIPNYSFLRNKYIYCQGCLYIYCQLKFDIKCLSMEYTVF